MRFLVFLSCAVALLAGCDTQRIYEYDQNFKDRSWKVTDTARFEFTIKDPGKRYNLYYNIRNSVDYPFARLFVQFSLKDSVGSELRKKLVSAFLFDQITGRPQGNSGLGDVYDHRFPLLRHFEFNIPGKYRLALEQFLRKERLAGVPAVGLSVR